MATKTEIRHTLEDELKSILSEFTDSPADHVRPSDQKVDGPLPVLTYESFEAALQRGFDRDIHTDSIEYDDDGKLDSVTFRREKTVTFDIAAHTADADVDTATKLYDAVEDHFTFYTKKVGDPTDFHPDVEDIELHGTEDVSQPDDAVHGKRLRIDCDYYRFHVLDDIDVIEEIAIDLDVDDDDDVGDSEDGSDDESDPFDGFDVTLNFN